MKDKRYFLYLHKTTIMQSVYFYMCASILLRTIASQCPASTLSPCTKNDETETETETESESESETNIENENENEIEKEDTCKSHDDCSKGQICCTTGCFKECVDSLEEPEITTVSPQTKIRQCFSQLDCGESQCCSNATAGAQTGICQDNKQIADVCHNPNPTGFYRSQCSGPSTIIHPDLCPCDCDNLCSPGPPDEHGGYRGICLFD